MSFAKLAPAVRVAVIASLLAGTMACATRGGTPGAAPSARRVEVAMAMPESVATAFFAAQAEARWRDAVSHLDLTAFDAWRRSLLAPRPPERVTPLTVEQLMEMQPDMPRAVAEYHVRQMERTMASVGAHELVEFADVPSLDSLRRLTTEEAAARWLYGQDIRWQARLAAREQRCPLPEALADSIVGPIAPHVIVAVARRDTVAWVLHEPARQVPSAADSAGMAREPREFDPAVGAWHVGTLGMRLMELRLRAGGWRIMASSTMLTGSGSHALVVSECRTIDAPEPPGR